MRSWNQAAAKPAMRQAACAVAVLLALFGVAACRRAAPPTDEASGTTTHTLTAGGEQREYRLYVPPGVSAPAPLVLMLAFSFWRFHLHTGYWGGIAENANMNFTAGRCHNIVTQAFRTQAELDASNRRNTTSDGRRVSLPGFRKC